MQNDKPVILVVDDDPVVSETLKAVFDARFNVLFAGTAQESLTVVAREPVTLVFLDVQLPDKDGLEVLKKIKEYDSRISVVMVTATDSAKTAVEALQSGACHYVTKPFDPHELLAIAEKALERERLMRELTSFRALRDQVGFGAIIGKSRQVREVFDIIRKVVENEATVFICGESGTGKELIARSIHCNSARKQGPFIAVNCASIPDNLIESELFGHERGAFTDAAHQKLGMFELAHDGTLFLDEISTLKTDTQAKLLRALEEREIKRLGGTKILKVNARIISATNSDVRQAISEGKFRQDLYYRLNVIPIYVPALRDRKDDIPLLAQHFLQTYNRMFRKNIRGISEEVLECFSSYEWPGNIRELRNVIERLVALKDEGPITLLDIPFDMFVRNTCGKVVCNDDGLKTACRNFEKQYIEAVLERTSGNQSQAARILGIHRNALSNKMKTFGLQS